MPFLLLGVGCECIRASHGDEQRQKIVNNFNNPAHPLRVRILAPGLGKTTIVILGEMLCHRYMMEQRRPLRPRVLLVPTSIVGCQYVRQWLKVSLDVRFYTVGLGFDEFRSHHNVILLNDDDPDDETMSKVTNNGTMVIIVYSTYRLYQERRKKGTLFAVDAIIADDYHIAIRNEEGKIHQSVLNAPSDTRFGATSATPLVTNFIDIKSTPATHKSLASGRISRITATQR